MVFLYNRRADWMFFSTDGWNELLTKARTYGWRNAGTQPPPAALDIDSSASETVTWDGNYTRPLGQSVTPDDALALGAAVDLALQRGADWKSNRAAVIRAFPAFCRQRGFIVSANLFMDRPAASRDAASAPDLPRHRVAS